MEPINWRRFWKRTALLAGILIVGMLAQLIGLNLGRPLSIPQAGVILIIFATVMLILELCDAKAERIWKQSPEVVIADKIKSFERPRER